MVKIKKDIWDAINAAPHVVVNGALKFKVKGGQVSAAKYLTRTMKLNETHKDDEIRDMAEQIEAKLAETLTVVECTTPEAYTEMFKAGNSCMTVHGFGTWGGEYVSNVGLDILNRFGLWSSMWYHYNPHCRGFYLLNCTKPVARCFLLDNGAIGSLYGASHTGLLQDKMKEIVGGIKGNPYNVPITKDFEVPGVQIGETYYAPIPNCDNFKKPFYATFDKPSGKFLFSGKEGSHKITDTYAYKQWLPDDRCL